MMLDAVDMPLPRQLDIARSAVERYAAQVREAGCPLFVFTCNTPRRVELALSAGATGIISDRPGWLAGYLRERNAGP